MNLNFVLAPSATQRCINAHARKCDYVTYSVIYTEPQIKKLRAKNRAVIFGLAKEFPILRCDGSESTITLESTITGFCYDIDHSYVVSATYYIYHPLLNRR